LTASNIRLRGQAESRLGTIAYMQHLRPRLDGIGFYNGPAA